MKKKAHRDETSNPVLGCWRTCGYSICDHAYAAGASNGDVDLALSEGGLMELGYPQNVPYSGSPVMLPNDPAFIGFKDHGDGVLLMFSDGSSFAESSEHFELCG